MPLVANRSRTHLAATRAVPPDFVAWPYVDTLYDYLAILDAPLARLPAALPVPRVAIVGAGVAGMVAAYELLKAGFRPVVYEATARIGGRCWSQHFTDDHGEPVAALAELGAMRVPTSARVFYHYAERFGLQTTAFPDPGKVATLLHYEDQLYRWKPAGKPGRPSPPPGPFARIAASFDGFIKLYTDAIYLPWQRQDWRGVRAVWQGYIDKYKHMSFFEALAVGIPGWKEADLAAFGALGIGSGGFGPLFDVGFLEILRIIINQWEVNQRLIQGGIDELPRQFYTDRVTPPAGPPVSFESIGAVRLNTPVIAIARGRRGQPLLTYVDPVTHAAVTQEYRAVIVATTTRQMEVLGLTRPTADGQFVLPESVRSALRNLHLISSSKMFIRTATKFWQADPRMPQTIQTDELPRGVYVLDYPQTENGVVLISYTWGDDSDKILGLDVPTRFALFKQILGAIHPPFARALVPLNEEILNIDWQAAHYYYGAFKLQLPGQEVHLRDAYYQFLSVLDPAVDRGVYLAGDSVSWSGGWVEGALQTGLNAAAAAARRLGAILPAQSPLSQNPELYQY